MSFYQKYFTLTNLSKLSKFSLAAAVGFYTEHKVTEFLATPIQEVDHFLDKNHNRVLWPKNNIQFIGIDQEKRKDAIDMLKTFIGFGIPSHVGIVNLFPKFISVSDSRLRIPAYVAWSIPHLQDDHKASAAADMKMPEFVKCWVNNYFSNFNPDNNDYLGSGYKRGLLANYEDFTQYDQISMDNTHLLIHNIIPQDSKNSSGYWMRMERFTRLLAYDFDSVHVIAGPAIVPEPLESNTPDANVEHPKGLVKYLVIGRNHVAVPTHLFRIIIAERKVTDQPTEFYAQAFLIPNSEIEKTDPLTKYTITLQELEDVTGLKFLSPLAKSTNMFPLCNLWHDEEETMEVSNIVQDTKLKVDIDPVKEAPPNRTANIAVKYGCNCNKMFPAWQDFDIQELLLKKEITEKEIEETWKNLEETTNWTPSKDISERKRIKLEELKMNETQ